jgi:hypothetical protein
MLPRRRHVPTTTNNNTSRATLLFGKLIATDSSSSTSRPEMGVLPALKCSPVSGTQLYRATKITGHGAVVLLMITNILLGPTEPNERLNQTLGQSARNHFNGLQSPTDKRVQHIGFWCNAGTAR